MTSLAEYILRASCSRFELSIPADEESMLRPSGETPSVPNSAAKLVGPRYLKDRGVIISGGELCFSQLDGAFGVSTSLEVLGCVPATGVGECILRRASGAGW